MRILIIGLTKELPLSPFDAMDIADKLVARAANAHTSGEYVSIVMTGNHGNICNVQWNVISKRYFICFTSNII